MALNQMHDRCDGTTQTVDNYGQGISTSCGAEALVQVMKGELDLVFCGHHYNQFQLELTNQGFKVVEDNRGKFITKQEILMGSEN